MATEDVNESLAAAEVPAIESKEKQPHKLERKWSFWFDNQSKPKQGAAWGASLRKSCTFDTVEDFWGCVFFSSLVSSHSLHESIFIPSKLTPNADIHLFKAGVEPKWEDPECANGGKWTYVVTNNRKQALDKAWLETLMALIGEQFEEADEICGVVASVRQKQDKLSLWTRTKSNEAVLMGIGKKWKELLDVTDKIAFTNHDDSRRSRFTV
ncbi:unnamed protein product [Eruca vesicaria subsp. sativa]|uniref:mRNA cap-binding protein n=1 Tax=Eruca vesicaria subsp. sativa TaxID=29727 RepID=A0ABC8KJ68_ERUVS|nr:unnamed protein product [Eruca vesicaria subsp. sativa]